MLELPLNNAGKKEDIWKSSALIKYKLCAAISLLALY
jgi:hypothetical protein